MIKIQNLKIYNFLNELVKVSPIVKYKKNTIILENDSIIENIYYIHSGEVKVRRENKIVKILNEGEIFGEIGLFNQIESLYEYFVDYDCSIIIISYSNIFLYLGDKYIQNFI